MGIILDLLNLAVYIPFLKVDEEDIGRNLKHLKKYQWFQSYLNDEKYRELIIYNKDVRQAIGKFKSNKLEKDSYNIKCQKRLHKVLLKKLNNVT
ncbi:hypothetical protein [Aneurinibacillus migulanus]|uniref:Uncharacterized protein n=1 Tax=Aneurinibacillus migulanus TaxID=47500 RepID=A0A0D1XQZ2_ANEMI|nr:hypothetical protein [Aneurinibacillus migulanus]KIV56731.1 hypothetical protein TS65_11565 [Aneurinibacillus migulanus]KON97105.1 hypothetical protein AF333_18170 [Aneurinibacillus migulanus]MED0896337.1 hypothetical protein [Aneurinibacillus migulanus]MED1618621.1 hypothetical protein [Aneurinibacillus migulanus]SDK03350.1 hypothetical protein SAMN04487909_13637 [Aneurinibacillus migulanus]